MAKSLPHSKTDLGVMVEFTYRIDLDEDAPQRTEIRVIHASRVLATWDDWLLDEAAWELERQRAWDRVVRKLEERRARGELTELDKRLEERNRQEIARRRERGLM